VGEALVEEGMGGMGPGGLLLQAGQTFALEGVEGIVDGTHGTVQVASDRRGALAVGAGEQNLAATDGEGLGGAQTRLQLLPFGSSEGANKGRWFHTSLFASSCAQTRPCLPLH